MFIFVISTLENIYTKKIENHPITSDYLFSKCIHIKNYIGSFIYYINNDNFPILTFKELIIPSSSSSEIQLNDILYHITINFLIKHLFKFYI